VADPGDPHPAGQVRERLGERAGGGQRGPVGVIPGVIVGVIVTAAGL
jgi:hypothetical protein